MNIDNVLKNHGIGDRRSNIKSIQRGTATLSIGIDLIVVQISTISINKSIIKITASSNNMSGDDSKQEAIQAKITSPTQLTFSRTTSTNDTIIVEWEVIEFNNVKSLQTGIFTTTNTSDLVSISNIKPEKSIIVFNYKELSGHGYIGKFLISGRINTSNQLCFTQASNINNKEIYWQVIEFI